MSSLVLDGVVRPGRVLDFRRSAVMPHALDLASPRPARPLAKPLQSVRRLDGVMVARPQSRQASLANVALAATMPMPAAILDQVLPAAGTTSERLKLPWRQIGIAFATIALATVAATGVRWQYERPQQSRARVQRANTAARIETVSRAQTSTVAALAPASNALQSQQLGALLTNWTSAHPGPFYIVVKDLKTGATSSINGTQQLTSASLYKLFVAQLVLGKVDTGNLDLSRSAGGGTRRNVSDCLAVMINVSDNDCGRALGAIIGWQQQDATLRASGYSATTFGNNDKPQLTSAADVATLLERLYQGTILSPNSSERLLGHLRDQHVNNRLPVGLPVGTVFAHKTGDLDGFVHDAGIVYGPKTDYIVSVMSGPWGAPGTAADQFGDLSAKLWSFFQQ